MNEFFLKDSINVEDVIYEINGINVMISYDLAKLYNCKNE